MPPCPICRARNPISHRTKKGRFSIYICSILCIKYFLICKIKRYVIMFLYIKIDFCHGRSGTADRERSWLSYPITFLRMSTYWKIMTRLKKQRWLLSAGVFRLPQKRQECFSEDHDRFISVDSVGREKSIYTTSNFFKLWCSY